MSDFIHKLAVKDYGCLCDVSVDLTPLHAFIGPNDSGKSTLLGAMRTAVEFAGSGFTREEGGEPEPFHPGPVSGIRIDAGSARLSSFAIEVAWRKMTYRIGEPRSVLADAGTADDPVDLFDVDEEILVDGQRVLTRRRRVRSRPDASALRQGAPASLDGAARFFMRRAQLLRLDPDALREPSPLIAGHLGSTGASFKDERGRGLAGVYDVILNQDVAGFLAIQERVRALFPGVKAIGLENVSTSTKVLKAQMASGEWIPARFLSEGLLYYLAFAALQNIKLPAVFLVEEPENGLHPARIAEVMRILREISKVAQVLIATHSPLVVNELQPDEVSIVTRKPDTGTKVTRLKDTPDFEARSKVYALGELWIAYANGEDEAPLLEGREP